MQRLGISKHVHYCKRKRDTIFIIFLLRCLKPLLPKFQRLSVVCLITGDNTRTEFFGVPSKRKRKRFFTGVSFVAVDVLILFVLPGSQRDFFVLLFFGSEAAIAAIEMVHSTKIICI